MKPETTNTRQLPFPWVRILFLLLMNLSLSYFMWQAMQFASLRPKLFLLAETGLIILILLVNILFLLTFSKRGVFRKTFALVLSIFLALAGVYGVYAMNRVGNAINSIVDQNEPSTTNETPTTQTDVTEPFTLAVFGTNEGLPDSIIIATLNPQTLRITMTSIPRDSYVPIACTSDNGLDKLNHSAFDGGLSCTRESLENLLDINIDHYVQVDFYGLIDIVDALGGLELTVDHTITTAYKLEDSDEYKNVTVPEGTHLLNGEQVLTFARERYSYLEGDFARQQNQQYVIKELIRQIASTRDVNKLLNVLETVASNDNLTTDFTTKQLTDLGAYFLNAFDDNALLQGMDHFRIESSRVTGISLYRYSPALGSDASVVDIYAGAVEDAHNFITGNLETKKTDSTQDGFSFDGDEPYTVDPSYSEYYQTGTIGDLYGSGS